MTSIGQTLKKEWLEKTDSQPANIAIGTTKFLAGGALTLLAIHKFPRVGLAGGIALSLASTVDLMVSIKKAKPGPNVNFDLVAESDPLTGLGKIGMRPFARAIQLATIASLLKTVGTTLYLRNNSLPVGAARVFGGLAGVAIVGLTPGVESLALIHEYNSDDYSGTERLGCWFGVWHTQEWRDS